MEVTLTRHRGKWKGQVGDRMAGRQARIFEHPRGDNVPSRTGRHQELKHLKYCMLTRFSDDQGKDNGQLLGYKFN